MMPLRGRLCYKQSYMERIQWVPSVLSRPQSEQLTAQRVIDEPRQAARHEPLVAFRSVFALRYANVVPASVPELQTEANTPLY